MEELIATREFDVRVSVVGGSTMLVRGQDAYELRDVETLIWSLSDGTRTVREIADAVVREYDVDLATAVRDVGEFLTELSDEGLVELQHTP